jgi:hypothetical protein
MADLAAWNSFYVIVGSSAGALTGLQFVVMTLIAERSPPRAAEAGPAFATPTIVHFGAVLLLAAVLCAPWQEAASVAAIVGLMGMSGVVYIIIVARRMRVQTTYKPEFGDWVALCSAAFGGIRNARAIGIYDSSTYDRSSVWRWSCGAAAAIHRHS